MSKDVDVQKHIPAVISFICCLSVNRPLQEFTLSKAAEARCGLGAVCCYTSTDYSVCTLQGGYVSRHKGVPKATLP